MRRERLVAARKAVGRSQEQVAELVGVDRTTVGTWERGEYTPHPTQRPAYADAVGVTLAELAELLDGASGTAGAISDWLADYLAFEQSAITLSVHEPRVVHGLLQTPEYVEALVGRLRDREAPAAYVRRVVDQRVFRQKRVCAGQMALHVIQPEQALRLVVGSPAVMCRQLERIVDLARLPNVTFQVTTFADGQYEAMRIGNFTVATLPWSGPRAYVEDYVGGRMIGDAEEVGRVVGAFEYARRIALPPQESVTFVQGLVEDWRINA